MKNIQKYGYAKPLGAANNGDTAPFGELCLPFNSSNYRKISFQKDRKIQDVLGFNGILISNTKGMNLQKCCAK